MTPKISMTRMSNWRLAMANAPTVHRTMMMGMRRVGGMRSTVKRGLVSSSPKKAMATVAMNTMAVTSNTKAGASIMISGPGRMPWMNSAAKSTAAGADPGTASVSTGMRAPGTAALLPVSAAISPSTEPLPNLSFSLEEPRAAAYETQAPMSSPPPGIRPIRVPMTPERMMVTQYLNTSRTLGMTEDRKSVG